MEESGSRIHFFEDRVQFRTKWTKAGKNWPRLHIHFPVNPVSEEDAIFCLMKDSTLFLLFCLTNPAQANLQGLVAGSLRFQTDEGVWVDCSLAGAAGEPVPQDPEALAAVTTAARNGFVILQKS
jgi:hypothetical protein